MTNRFGCGNNYNETYGYGSKSYGTSTSNPNVVRIDLEKKKPTIIALIRNFRENSVVYTEEAYKHLLRRLCKACEVPNYKPNLPIFMFSPDLESNYTTSVKPRGKYIKGEDRKELHIRKLTDLKAFVGTFYLYIKKRNNGFSYDSDENVVLKGESEEAKFSRDVMEKSKPQIIRNFEKRSFIKEVSL